MTRPNIALLDATLSAIRREVQRGTESQWNQEAWRCDTGMCFAGWAAHLAGATWAHLFINDPGHVVDNLMVITPDGKEWHVMGFAETMLRLPWHVVRELFNPVNTLEELEAIVADVKAGYGITHQGYLCEETVSV